MADYRLTDADDFINSGAQQDARDERDFQAQVDAAREARWLELEHAFRNQYLFYTTGWGAQPPALMVAWGWVASVIAGLMRWDEFPTTPDVDITTIRVFAASDGWADVWRVFARVVEQAQAQAEDAAQLLREGRY